MEHEFRSAEPLSWQAGLNGESEEAKVYRRVASIPKLGMSVVQTLIVLTFLPCVQPKTQDIECRSRDHSPQHSQRMCSWLRSRACLVLRLQACFFCFSQPKLVFHIGIVSGQSRRFKSGGYDLDLAYVTDRVIAMSFPFEGTAGTELD